MKFIEGPYRADPESGAVTFPHGDLARVYWTKSDEEAYDNTVRLLAASLDMYEALSAIMADPPGWSTAAQCEAYEKAAAALAKAEGRANASTN